VGSDGSERGLSVGGSPEDVAAYLRDYAALGVAEVIWIFRNPFDVETIQRLGDVRHALP
jgi:alkanesulfonate monooxygenase SsuD/methylene tetrahydromethanopterin reductase-like flavin-dependent oxidoreductase (luciferase family)